MTRWEYKAVFANVDELNRLGTDGWELVSAVFKTDVERTVCYLKRPLT
ncbi:hypothetical protein AB0C10_36695 [Microbispora amethystogenes]